MIPRNTGSYKAHRLRGAIADLYREWPILHQHVGDKYAYRHPLVQYKVLDGVLMVAALGLGAEVLAGLQPPTELSLNHSLVEIAQVRIYSENYIPNFQELKPFRFLTPWLALNEKNHQLYREHEVHERRIKITRMLESILIGNILSFSKGLGLSVPNRLNVQVDNWKAGPMRARHKGSGLMVGFEAAGIMSFTPPPFWGLGKQSSRGNGVISI